MRTEGLDFLTFVWLQLLHLYTFNFLQCDNLWIFCTELRYTTHRKEAESATGVRIAVVFEDTTVHMYAVRGTALTEVSTRGTSANKHWRGKPKRVRLSCRCITSHQERRLLRLCVWYYEVNSHVSCESCSVRYSQMGAGLLARTPPRAAKASTYFCRKCRIAQIFGRSYSGL